MYLHSQWQKPAGPTRVNRGAYALILEGSVSIIDMTVGANQYKPISNDRQ
jgi:hypothetical protein